MLLVRSLFLSSHTPKRVRIRRRAIFVFPSNLNIIDAEFAPHFFKLLPVCLSITGAFLALFLYTFSSKDLYLLKTSIIGRKVYNFLNKKWFFDKFYN